ncbi:MAG: hypothetical protein ACLQBD_17510 [Syntrophobacteraceae bacterium]
MTRQSTPTIEATNQLVALEQMRLFQRNIPVSQAMAFLTACMITVVLWPPLGARRQAHTIRGGCGHTWRSSPERGSFELEEIGKEGGLVEALNVLPRLEIEFERLNRCLEQNGWA